MHASIIFFSACILAATAFPANDYVPILFKSEVQQPDGSYQIDYQTGDGQAFAENAQAKANLENDGVVLVKSGHYAYTAPDGTPISVAYIADENGFRVSGAHIPTPPPALPAQF